MTARVLLLNPNSSVEVTAAAAGAASAVLDVPVHADQLADAPPAIESPDDHAVVAPLVVDYLRRHEADYHGVVLACHGDPGMREARAVAGCPVVGIGAASLHAAAALGERIAVLTPAAALVDPKWRQLTAAGLADRCVAVEPVAGGVLGGLGADADPEPFVRAAEKAVTAGADAIVLGCAGYVAVAERVQERVDAVVVEPVSVAAAVLRAVLRRADRGASDN
ncbi:MAG: hypothetical protein GEV07_07030 [Streptosporangiales bacterium]|nr:hypothetical protein [Streptosporangiales bacterium]